MIITLTGQSMIRGGTRVDAPEAVSTIKSLIKGDIAFTNFEAAVFNLARALVIDGGAPRSPTRFENWFILFICGTSFRCCW